MNKISNSFTSIEQVASQYLNQPQKNTNLQIEKNGLSFEEILMQKQYLKQNEATTLKFSKHAVNRLEEREISLSNEQVDRLNEGARKASEKGITCYGGFTCIYCSCTKQNSSYSNGFNNE